MLINTATPMRKVRSKCKCKWVFAFNIYKCMRIIKYVSNLQNVLFKGRWSNYLIEIERSLEFRPIEFKAQNVRHVQFVVEYYNLCRKYDSQ